MNRIIKILCMVGLALCILGGGIYAIGVAAGGRTNIRKTGMEPKQAKEVKLDEIKLDEIKLDDVTSDQTASGEEEGSLNKEVSKQQKHSSQKSKAIQTFYMEKTQLEKFHSIQLDFNNVDLEIKPSGDQNSYLEYTIDSKTKDNPLQMQIKDSVLTMAEDGAEEASFYKQSTVGFFNEVFGSDQTDNKFLNYIFGSDQIESYTSLVTLYVPEDQHFEKCSFQLGKGDMEIKGLQSDEIKVSMKEGDLKWDGLQLQSGKFDLSMEEGDFSLTDSILQNSRVVLKEGDITGKNIAIQGVSVVESEGDIEFIIDSDNNMDLSVYAEAKDGDIEVSGQFDGKVSERGDASVYQHGGERNANTLKMISTDGDISIR